MALSTRRYHIPPENQAKKPPSTLFPFFGCLVRSYDGALSVSDNDYQITNPLRLSSRSQLAHAHKATQDPSYSVSSSLSSPCSLGAPISKPDGQANFDKGILTTCDAKNGGARV
ncbi:hypothetical protein PIIN_05340 [Serendipita indica DSM 11827]|uniref:Uncharacterized protein n=1 Tax=Serendipita indica (strain DSM 11827) TaxID=1109443 RepID=G4TJA0_SERID|nr:hypothetical protein PIIN_05340 [Serendipita indica DSM 11827]